MKNAYLWHLVDGSSGTSLTCLAQRLRLLWQETVSANQRSFTARELRSGTDYLVTVIAQYPNSVGESTSAKQRTSELNNTAAQGCRSDVVQASCRAVNCLLVDRCTRMDDVMYVDPDRRDGEIKHSAHGLLLSPQGPCPGRPVCAWSRLGSSLCLWPGSAPPPPSRGTG